MSLRRILAWWQLPPIAMSVASVIALGDRLSVKLFVDFGRLLGFAIRRDTRRTGIAVSDGTRRSSDRCGR